MLVYHGGLVDRIKSHNGYVEEHRGRLSIPLWWTHFVVGFWIFRQNVREGESAGRDVRNKMGLITENRDLAPILITHWYSALQTSMLINCQTISQASSRSVVTVIVVIASCVGRYQCWTWTDLKRIYWYLTRSHMKCVCRGRRCKSGWERARSFHLFLAPRR